MGGISLGEDMKRFLMAASALGASALFGASAYAQTPYNWSGFYAGVNAGFAHSADDAIKNTGTDTDGGGLGAGIVAGIVPSTIRRNNDTGLFGLQGGYNWQFGMWVLGGEADIDGGFMSHQYSTTRQTLFSVPVTTNASRELDWLMTFRGRAGVTPINSLLLYLTGGLAVGENKNGASFVCPTCSPPASTEASTTTRVSDTNVGWTAGTGAEWAFAPQWSIKAEYLYVDLGDTNAGLVYNYGASTSTLNAKFHNSDHIFRLGANFHFGVPTPPPATPVVAAPPPPPAPPAVARQMFIVFFEFDKSSLTPDGKKVVDAAADAFKKGKSDIAIAGYTDLSGSAQYNLALSHRRADAVQAALVKDGVPAPAIGESWYGKQNPRVPTADGVREPQNRRVEITM
jgi:outer membrane protein OmpA-like peptidoglycan-associated protein